MMTIQVLPAVVLAVVIICWLAFGVAFLLRPKPPFVPDHKRDFSSVPGLVLQLLSYLIVWVVRRPLFTPFISFNKTLAVLTEVIAIVVAVASVALMIVSVRTLGKEWSLTARVVAGHKLATIGPYNFVRHPIYTGMLGVLLATGIANSYWPALLIAMCVLIVGTWIRIRSEERLLREMFGVEYDAYIRRVSALIPGIY